MMFYARSLSNGNAVGVLLLDIRKICARKPSLSGSVLTEQTHQTNHYQVHRHNVV